MPEPPAGFASNAVFEKMRTNIEKNPAVVKKVNGCLHFKVSGQDGAKASWIVDAKVGSGKVSPEEPSENQKADVTIMIGDADLVALASGKLSAMSAYMSGKIKLKGKVALAQKMGALLSDGKPKSKL